MPACDRSLPGQAGLPPVRRGDILSLLFGIDARFRQRRAFERLESHRLRDLGLEDADSTLPKWNAPDWWR